jgi:hypothetical protein
MTAYRHSPTTGDRKVQTNTFEDELPPGTSNFVSFRGTLCGTLAHI